MIIPLKKSVRDRKFDQKIPIVIPARAGPSLKCSKLLWMMVAINPCASDRLSSAPLSFGSRIYAREVLTNLLISGHRTAIKRNLRPSVLMLSIISTTRNKLCTMHTPRIVGAATLSFGGCTEAQLKAKGRWSSDMHCLHLFPSLPPAGMEPYPPDGIGGCHSVSRERRQFM